MKKMILLALSAFLTLQPAHAALHILADYGGEPVERLYEGLNRDTPLTPAPSAASPSPLSATGFPILTPELTPGEVAPRTFQAPGITPLFLIGDDPRSREWLKENGKVLESMHATGIVVNVASPQQLAALQSIIPGAVLVPSSGSDIARRLQLAHYPVLITPSGLSGRIAPW